MIETVSTPGDNGKVANGHPEGENTRKPINQLDDVQTVADLNATLDLLEGMGSVDDDRMAIIGHSLGYRSAATEDSI